MIEAMLFETSKIKINRFSVTINGSAIKGVAMFIIKYLAAYLDKYLSWNEHVKPIVSTAGR